LSSEAWPAGPAPDAAPATYYVDAVNGTDSPGAGTMSSPWRTLSYALGEVTGTSSDPVILLVAEGTYLGSVTLEPYVEIDGGHQPFSGCATLRST
jgi:hypothetical protein